MSKFGLAPFIKKQMIKEVGDNEYVIMFDESLNRTTKNKQLDIHIRYWVTNEKGTRQVMSRYMGSQFMGHGSATDLITHFKKGLAESDMNLHKMLSISMDGPNVNWKFIDLLQTEHGEQFGGQQLLIVGSCGLHTLHNSFKSVFSMWTMEKLLRALHYLFHETPARREDFTKLTKSSIFPLPFCGHRWIENLPVVERAIEIWENIVKYVEAVDTKKLPKSQTASFDTVAVAKKDPLILAKLHFFMALSQNFTPFLTKYQTDLPFLDKDLADLISSVLKRFIKKEHLPTNAESLCKLEVADTNKWVIHQDVDIGIGAESALKSLRKSNTISKLAVMEFNNDCLKGLSAMCKKMLEKSPLKYSLVHQLGCMDPRTMYQDKDMCLKKMKGLVKKLIHEKQMPGGVTTGDVVMQQFSAFLDMEETDSSFESFSITQTMIDMFLDDKMSKYPELWNTTKKILLLSHGQATVERGFSINKKVEICNMSEDTVVAHRLVCDYVNVCGGITKVPITKELCTFASTYI